MEAELHDKFLFIIFAKCTNFKKIMTNEQLSLWKDIKAYFDMSNDKDREAAIIEGITATISFRGANLWILIFAIFIASLGLNVNSTAVIIGAMLISPLMGPILGIGLAVGINDLPLLKRAGKNLFIASMIGIITATIYFFLTPFKDTQSELLARTAPTIYDVLIALFGGAAGITAQCAKDKGNVIPGVAIATALMPPLCTAGYGLATGNLAYFAGAFFLYFINTVFITVATYIGVRLMRFHQTEFADAARRKFVHRVIAAIVILTMIPAGMMTLNLLKDSLFDRQLGLFVKENLRFKGTEIVAKDVINDSTLKVVAVGNAISEEQIAKAQTQMNKYSGLKGIHLEIIQGMQPDSLIALEEEMGFIRPNAQNKVSLIQEQSLEIEKLKEAVTNYQRYDKATKVLRPEIKTLYPNVRSLTLTPVKEMPIDTLPPRKYVLALVKLAPNYKQSESERQRMKEWLKARTNTDSLVLVTTK